MIISLKIIKVKSTHNRITFRKINTYDNIRKSKSLAQ